MAQRVGMLEPLPERRDFLAVAAAKRKWASPGFVLQARLLPAPSESRDRPRLPRVGFTASKKVGNAVARNRAKRRLRAAVRRVAEDLLACHRLLAGGDIVVIARAATVDHPFEALVADLHRGFEKLAITPRQPRAGGSP